MTSQFIIISPKEVRDPTVEKFDGSKPSCHIKVTSPTHTYTTQKFLTSVNVYNNLYFQHYITLDETSNISPVIILIHSIDHNVVGNYFKQMIRKQETYYWSTTGTLCCWFPPHTMQWLGLGLGSSETGPQCWVMLWEIQTNNTLYKAWLSILEDIHQDWHLTMIEKDKLSSYTTVAPCWNFYSQAILCLYTIICLTNMQTSDTLLWRYIVWDTWHS